MAVSPRLCLAPILDTNGVPISGALVNVYAAGTTTPLSLYTNEALSASAANPMVCTAGFVPLRFMASASYKLVVTTSAGATVTGYDGDNIDPGVAIGSGALAIANGGTAATTAASARTNLSAASSTDMATAQSDISNLNTWTGYSLTTRSRMASGTTAQQPSAANYSIRSDSTTGRLLWDNTSAWRNVLTAGDWTATDMMTGGIVQVVDATPYTSNSDITTVIPFDDTIPLITEGTEILTVAITPKHASSIMKIEASLPMVGGTAAATQIIAAIFKSTQSGAIAATAIQQISNTNPLGFPPVYVSDTPGSVTPITYSVRLGQSATGAVRANGGSGARYFGGVSACNLRVIEVRG